MIQAMAPLIASSPDERVTSVAVQGLHHLFKMDTDGDMHCVQVTRSTHARLELGESEGWGGNLNDDRWLHGLCS